MRWSRLAAVTVAGVLYLLAVGMPVQAASYDWGYNPARTRSTDAPIAGLVAGGEATTGQYAVQNPYLVPLPGSSQSTAVIVGGQWYLQTYWDHGQQGALWTGHLIPPSGPTGQTTSTPGTEVLGLSAQGDERFNTPADAAVSADGRWAAFAAGVRLWVWPTGDPAQAAVFRLVGPNPADNEVSSSPVFVPDPGAPNGLAVCSTSWNGSAYCYPVLDKSQLAAQFYFITPTARYLSPAGPHGLTEYGADPITSSPAYDPSTGDIYFGVASWGSPRVVAMNPLTGAVDPVIGLGTVQAPIWSTPAVMGGSVYASDMYGNLYRFDASTGAVQAWTEATGLPGYTDIQSIAATPSGVFFLGDGYRQFFELNPQTLGVEWSHTPSAEAYSAYSSASDPTAVSTGSGQPPQIIFASTEGELEDIIPPNRTATWATGAAPTENAFTAPTVDGTRILMWGQGAEQFWVQAGSKSAAPPQGSGAPQEGNALQIWSYAPMLSVFVSPQRTIVGEPIGPTGLRAYVLTTAPGTPVLGSPDAWPSNPLAPTLEPGAPQCPGPLSGQPANFGDVGVAISAAGLGCGVWGTSASLLQTVETQDTVDAPFQYPGWVGATMTQWQAEPTGYTAWQVLLTPPTAAGEYPITVCSTGSNGEEACGTAYFAAYCPSQDTTASDGQCIPPAAPPSRNPNGDNCGGGNQPCPPPYSSSGPTFTGSNCIKPNLPFYPGSCVTAWLTNPAHPPVCGQTPIGGNQWNPHPGCITDSGGVVRDPNAPGGWAILPNREYNPAADCAEVLPANDCPPPSPSSQG